MTVVFVGHGGRNKRDDMVVPPGVTIKFYVDFDLNLNPINAEAVLSRMEFGNPNQVYGPGDAQQPTIIPNYELSPLRDDEMQRDMSAARSLANVVFADSRTWLCTTPDTCQSLPAHTCLAGLLGQAAARGETDVVFLACRSVVGEDAAMGSRLGAAGQDEKVAPEVIEWANGFLARAEADPEAAAAEWDGLSVATQAMLLNDRNLRAWSATREQVIPSEPAVVLEARRYLDAYGDQTFATWVETLNEKQLDLLWTDDKLFDAYVSGRAAADQAALAPEPDSADSAHQPTTDTDIISFIEMVQQATRSFTGRANVLTGVEDVDEGVVLELFELLEELLQDLTLLKAAADQEYTRNVANGVEQQAAAAKDKLENYFGTYGEELLAPLVAAAAATDEWARALR